MFEQLSWMIYWAEALDKLGSLLTVAILILMCTSAVTIFLVPPMVEGSVDTASTSKVWRHWSYTLMKVGNLALGYIMLLHR